MIGARRRILMDAPHPVTLTGALVHFQTDFPGLMQITGSGDITVCGKNMIDDSKRYQQASGYSLYIGNTSSGYGIYLPAGEYRFTAEMLSGASYDLYYKKSDKAAVYIWHKEDAVTTATFTLTEAGMYRFNMTSANKNLVGSCCVSAAADTGYEAYAGTTLPAGSARKALIGINNVFSDSGNVLITYWTH